MIYNNVCKGRFVRRINRFVAQVEIGGWEHTVHVKNTGRMKELLQQGATVWLEQCDGAHRKTAYYLIAVEKAGLGIVYIDSVCPNKVMAQWLAKQDYDMIKAEHTFGRSRIDFYMEKNGEKYLLEVKGCTLEIDGIGYFPDAPTLRGIKHLEELTAAVQEGYHAAIAFVIQMPRVTHVLPNRMTHPEFALALEKAQAAGVEIWYKRCSVSPEEVYIL